VKLVLTGETGATGAGFTFRGSFNKTTLYNKNDIVINDDLTQLDDPNYPGFVDNNTYIYITDEQLAGFFVRACKSTTSERHGARPDGIVHLQMDSMCL
jgi:hypothetical protein